MHAIHTPIFMRVTTYTVAYLGISSVMVYNLCIFTLPWKYKLHTLMGLSKF